MIKFDFPTLYKNDNFDKIQSTRLRIHPYSSLASSLSMFQRIRLKKEGRKTMSKLILASQSPRRKELLERLRIPFDVKSSNIEEIIQPNQSPEEVVQSLAFQKALPIAKENRDCFTIGADTVVVYEQSILGKPASREEAIETLRQLSGKTHQVLTGISIHHNGKHLNFYEQTDVTFYDLTMKEIEAYIETNEPFDKAGSYGIQGYGSLFVKEIKGDYFNVVGLPIAALYRALIEMKFPFES